jgi:signal transduction histidine kinase
MDARRARRLAWTVWTLAMALVVGAVVFLVLGRATPNTPTSFAFRGYGILLTLAFGTAGLLIASRVPSNPIGWILLAAGLGTAIQELAHQYAIYGLYDSPGAVPGADVAAWLEGWIWIPIMFGVAVCTPLLYPDGRLLSRRWRGVAILGAVGAVGGAIGFALSPGELDAFPGVGSPFGLEAAWVRPAGGAMILALLAAMLGAAASVVIRFRRSRGDERLQLKWLALALSLLGGAFGGFFPIWIVTHGEMGVGENLIVAGLVAIPVAIGVAILKYRLYEIDLVIRKTVVYVVLAVLLFAFGLTVVWAFGGLIAGIFGEDSAYAYLAGGITIGIAVWPLRRLAIRIADRLVFGRRATPYQVLTEFSDRVAGTYAADDVLERMAQVLAAGIGARSATVWLRGRAGFHPGATWPTSQTAADLPPDAIEVRHHDEVLGALSVRMPANDPMTPVKERLIRDLAGQAGLVLRNAKLIEDLRASRQRLVAAQDEERRRIERNIHDGAQQQLVTLAVKLGLIERLLPPEAGRAAAMLAEAKVDTNDTLETLRDLARGIYPPLLADGGLAAALAAQSRKSSLPVTVESDGVGRFPPELEAAIYFSCLEALQNAAKHSGASAVTIRITRSDGLLTFEVRDDGKGFDPAVVGHGTGLQGIADRLAALGGTLEINSAPGAGTTVAGRVPVEARR